MWYLAMQRSPGKHAEKSGHLQESDNYCGHDLYNTVSLQDVLHGV